MIFIYVYHKLIAIIMSLWLSLVSIATIPTVEIAPGVFYPMAQMGACTDCKTSKVPCCGTNLSATLPAWSAATQVMAIDTQLRYNDTKLVAQELSLLGRPRSRVWITTKIDPKAYCVASDLNVTATALAMVVENLLQLNTSFVDLLLLHEPCNKNGEADPRDAQAWAALEQAKWNGWARAIGVDKFTPNQIDHLGGSELPAVLMLKMSLTKHDDATLAYCADKGIHVNAYGVMGGCMFTDPMVLRLAAKYDATPAAVCCAWTRQRGCSMALGFGTDASKAYVYISEDLGGFGFNMTNEEVDALSALAPTG